MWIRPTWPTIRNGTRGFLESVNSTPKSTSMTIVTTKCSELRTAFPDTLLDKQCGTTLPPSTVLGGERNPITIPSMRVPPFLLPSFSSPSTLHSCSRLTLPFPHWQIVIPSSIPNSSARTPSGTSSSCWVRVGTSSRTTPPCRYGRSRRTRNTPYSSSTTRDTPLGPIRAYLSRTYPQTPSWTKEHILAKGTKCA